MCTVHKNTRNTSVDIMCRQYTLVTLGVPGSARQHTLLSLKDSFTNLSYLDAAFGIFDFTCELKYFRKNPVWFL